MAWMTTHRQFLTYTKQQAIPHIIKRRKMFVLEINSPVAPARLFKTMVDWPNLGPKVMPKIIASAAHASGDGSNAGSTRQINFTSAMPNSTYVKDRVDFIDHEKLEGKYTVVEGGDLGKKFETASIHYKFVPAGNGGCVVKVEGTSKPVPGAAADKDTAEAKEGVAAMIKAVEAYLLANPAAYA